MSNDFLSHLTWRSLRSTEVDSTTSELRPRIASRFEPPVTPIMPLGDTPLEAEVAYGAESMQAVRPRAMPMHHEHGVDEQARLSDRDQAQAMANRVAHLEIPAPQVAVRSETPPVASSPNGAEPMATSSMGSNERPVAQPEPTLPASRRLAPIEPAQPIGIDSGPARDDTLQWSATSVAQRQATLAVAAPLNKVVPDRIKIAQLAAKSLTSATEARLVPATAMPERKPQPLEVEAVPRAPTIHVTIGRIEVRAAPPIASPRRTPPASPAMSLDEYLRQRRGGDR